MTLKSLRAKTTGRITFLSCLLPGKFEQFSIVGWKGLGQNTFRHRKNWQTIQQTIFVDVVWDFSSTFFDISVFVLFQDHEPAESDQHWRNASLFCCPFPCACREFKDKNTLAKQNKKHTKNNESTLNTCKMSNKWVGNKQRKWTFSKCLCFVLVYVVSP